MYQALRSMLGERPKRTEVRGNCLPTPNLQLPTPGDPWAAPLFEAPCLWELELVGTWFLTPTSLSLRLLPCPDTPDTETSLLMRFAILGSGAVGGYYGAKLARAGHDVTFIARGAHLAAIRERGLEIRSPMLGDFTVRAPGRGRHVEGRAGRRRRSSRSRRTTTRRRCRWSRRCSGPGRRC